MIDQSLGQTLTSLSEILQVNLAEKESTINEFLESKNVTFSLNSEKSLRVFVYAIFTDKNLQRKLDAMMQAKARSTDPVFKQVQKVWNVLPHRLIKNNWDLIKKAAVRYHLPNSIDQELDFNDLLSVGNEALMLAAEKYFWNPRGNFPNFAWNILREKIRDDQAKKHPVPFAVRKKLKALGELRESFYLDDKIVRLSDIKSHLGISDNEIKDLLKLEAIWGHGQDKEVDVEVDDIEQEDLSPSAVAMLIQFEDSNIVHNALSKMDPRNASIIEGVYFKEKSLRDQAEDMGVSLNSLKKSHKRALVQFKEVFKRNGLRLLGRCTSKILQGEPTIMVGVTRTYFRLHHRVMACTP